MIAKLNSLDRRFIYLTLFVITALSLIFPITLPTIPSTQVRAAFNAVEKAPVDKLCIINSQWSASTRGENGPQARALLHHLMRRHIKFAILGFDPQGPDNMNDIATELADKYGYKYGRDWIEWGYRNENSVNPFLKSLARSIPDAVKNDSKLTPVTDYEKLPIMKGIHDMKDVGLLIDVTPSNTAEAYVAFIQGKTNVPFVYFPTSVMAPEGYQYLDSGQMVGMVTGIKGAIEYEALVHEKKDATRQALALSMTHLLIIILIVLGNVGFIMEKKKRQTAGGGA
ncbi:MAG: hypothetical protein ABJA67_10470 [Chthonomonadales bacterium]